MSRSLPCRLTAGVRMLGWERRFSEWSAARAAERRRGSPAPQARLHRGSRHPGWLAALAGAFWVGAEGERIGTALVQITPFGAVFGLFVFRWINLKQDIDSHPDSDVASRP